MYRMTVGSWVSFAATLEMARTLGDGIPDTNGKEAFRTAMKYPIAAKDLIGYRADGERFPLKLRIGRPYRLEQYEWAVPVGLEGLYASLPDIHGEDSFEALSLSFALVHKLLTEFLEQGGRLYEMDGETPFEVGFPQVQWNSARFDRSLS